MWQAKFNIFEEILNAERFKLKFSAHYNGDKIFSALQQVNL